MDNVFVGSRIRQEMDQTRMKGLHRGIDQQLNIEPIIA